MNRPAVRILFVNTELIAGYVAHVHRLPLGQFGIGGLTLCTTDTPTRHKLGRSVKILGNPRARIFEKWTFQP